MRRNPFRLALASAGILAVLVGAQGAGAQEPAKQPTARGTGGAAATVDALGTQAAIDTLKAGGNAVDAAVAAAAVLGVTEPFSCGIGGGGFMVIRTAKGKVTTLDGREKAPREMKPDSFWENGKPLAFDPARFSGLSAGVPGTPLTWARALKKYGTFSLKRALQPGVRVATNGFTVDKTFFDSVEAVKTYFDDIPSTAAIYLDPDRTSKDVGTRITNPDMAKTYRLLGRQGVRKGFYRGAGRRGDGPGRHAAADRPGRRPHLAGRPDDHGRPQALHAPRSARRRRARTAASPSTAWGRRPAAARPWARCSTSSAATTPRAARASRSCTATWRPRATRSPTATPSSPTRRSSTSPSRACSRPRSPTSGAR